MELTFEVCILFAAFFLSIIFITLFYLGIISGMFTSVDVKTEKPLILNHPCLIAYKYLKGNYNTSGAFFTEATSISLTDTKIGIYFDDPNITSPYQCRAAIGSILSSEGDKPVSEEAKKAYTDHGYALHELPAVDMAVTSTFPHSTFISVYLAMAKVYPKLNDYVEINKLKPRVFVEIYEDETIHFIGPLDHQDDFMIPEVMSSLVVSEIPKTNTPETDESSSSSFELIQ